MDDINGQLGSDVTIEDIEATLPAQVTVEMESGAKVLANVTAWDTSKVDLTQAGTYEITGTVEGTDIPAIIKVVVQAEKFIESLTPEEINVSAVEGSTAEKVWNMIDKNVVANYSDGSTANLVVSDWDYSNVKFDEPGAYVATGTPKGVRAGAAADPRPPGRGTHGSQTMEAQPPCPHRLELSLIHI